MSILFNRGLVAIITKMVGTLENKISLEMIAIFDKGFILVSFHLLSIWKTAQIHNQHEACNQTGHMKNWNSKYRSDIIICLKTAFIMHNRMNDINMADDRPLRTPRCPRRIQNKCRVCFSDFSSSFNLECFSDSRDDSVRVLL